MSDYHIIRGLPAVGPCVASLTITHPASCPRPLRDCPVNDAAMDYAASPVPSAEQRRADLRAMIAERGWTAEIESAACGRVLSGAWLDGWYADLARELVAAGTGPVVHSDHVHGRGLGPLGCLACDDEDYARTCPALVIA